jgi:hypothetical protein
VNYHEAERVLADWVQLVARAERVYAELPAEQRAAFFQLVLYPVKASAGIQDLYIATGRNRLYARQGRASANAQAERARALFAADAELVRAYHQLNGGKWNHMMSQAKLGYTSWQQPDVETPPSLSVAQQADGASMGIVFEGDGGRVFPTGDGAVARLPRLDPVQQSRTVQLFSRATYPFEYRATSPQPWLSISGASGRVTSD